MFTHSSYDGGRRTPNESFYGNRPPLMPRITQKQRDQYKEVFMLFDTDRSGSISAPEIQAAADHMGHKISSQQVKEYMSLYDTDRSGELNFEQFVLFMVEKLEAMVVAVEEEMEDDPSLMFDMVSSPSSVPPSPAVAAQPSGTFDEDEPPTPPPVLAKQLAVVTRHLRRASLIDRSRTLRDVATREVVLKREGTFDQLPGVFSLHRRKTEPSLFPRPDSRVSSVEEPVDLDDVPNPISLRSPVSASQPMENSLLPPVSEENKSVGELLPSVRSNTFTIERKDSPSSSFQSIADGTIQTREESPRRRSQTSHAENLDDTDLYDNLSDFAGDPFAFDAARTRTRIVRAIVRCLNGALVDTVLSKDLSDLGVEDFETCYIDITGTLNDTMRESSSICSKLASLDAAILDNRQRQAQIASSRNIDAELQLELEELKLSLPSMVQEKTIREGRLKELQDQQCLLGKLSPYMSVMFERKIRLAEQEYSFFLSAANESHEVRGNVLPNMQTPFQPETPNSNVLVSSSSTAGGVTALTTLSSISSLKKTSPIVTNGGEQKKKGKKKKTKKKCGKRKQDRLVSDLDLVSSLSSTNDLSENHAHEHDSDSDLSSGEVSLSKIPASIRENSPLRSREFATLGPLTSPGYTLTSLRPLNLSMFDFQRRTLSDVVSHVPGSNLSQSRISPTKLVR